MVKNYRQKKLLLLYRFYLLIYWFYLLLFTCLFVLSFLFALYFSSFLAFTFFLPFLFCILFFLPFSFSLPPNYPLYPKLEVDYIFVYSNYKLRAGFRNPEQMLYQSRSGCNVFAATCKHYLTGKTHLFFVSSELTHFFLIFYSFPSSKVQTMTVSHVQVTIVSQKHSEVSCFPFLRTWSV